MLLSFATLAVLVFCISVGVVGAVLLWRGWRIVGGVLLAQALLATAALVLLSTLPFGIGEPLIRVPFRDILIQTLGSLTVIGGVAGLVYLSARWARTRLPREREPGAKHAGRRLATLSALAEAGDTADLSTGSPCLFCLGTLGKTPWSSAATKGAS